MLDYWVARADGLEFVLRGQQPAFEFDFDPERHAQEHVMGKVMKQYVWFLPSTNWAQGGPIIERERIDLNGGAVEECDTWRARTLLRSVSGQNMAPCYGMEAASPLVAAMRAFVASKFGEEVPDH